MDAQNTEQPVETPDSMMEELERAASVPVPTTDGEDLQVTVRSINARTEQVLEVSLTVLPENITETRCASGVCLKNVLQEPPKPSKEKLR